VKVGSLNPPIGGLYPPGGKRQLEPLRFESPTLTAKARRIAPQSPYRTRSRIGSPGPYPDYLAFASIEALALLPCRPEKRTSKKVWCNPHFPLDNPSGLGIMAAVLGKSVREYLAAIGRKGGSTMSPKKARAARVNGKKGGRPRKDKRQ
jgi:hypothetical protein